jgi:hypothetical protein
LDIRDLRSLESDASDEAAQTHAEGRQIEERFEERWNKTDLPALSINGEVSLPDSNESPG